MKSVPRALLSTAVALAIALPSSAQRNTPTGQAHSNPGAARPLESVEDRLPGRIPAPIILIEGRAPGDTDVVKRVLKTLLNERGDVVLEAELASGHIGIWRNRDNNIFEAIAKSNEFFGREGFEAVSIDEDGTVTFNTSRGVFRARNGEKPMRAGGPEERMEFAHADRDWIGMGNEDEIAAGPTESPRTLVRKGDRAPGLPDPIRFGGAARMHDARGHAIVFTGNVTGVTEPASLFLVNNDRVELAVRPGPSSPEGIDEVTRARVNRNGVVLVEGRSNGRLQHWMGRPGNFTRIEAELPTDGDLAIRDDGTVRAISRTRMSFGPPGAVVSRELPSDVVTVVCYPDSVGIVRRRSEGGFNLHAGQPTTLKTSVRTGDEVTMPNGKAYRVGGEEPRILSGNAEYLVVEIGIEPQADGRPARGIFRVPVDPGTVRR